MFLGLGGIAYAHTVEPTWVDITFVQLALPRLTWEFHNYRIVQISDIHMDNDSMTPDRLTEVIGLVNQQQPDLIAITGDFVTADHDGGGKISIRDLVPALSTLTPRDVVVAVLGNHDYEKDPVLVRQAIHESGIVNVSNTVYTVQRGEAMLHIAGVDDVIAYQDRLDLVLNQLPTAGTAILLAHEPDFADISAKTGRFDLQISGHSHGGQVIIPLVGPPALPPYARKYPLGRYQVGGMIQYTNRGLGIVPPRIRFNCRPEITVFTLEAV